MAITVPQQVLLRARRNAPPDQLQPPKFGSFAWRAQSIAGSSSITTVEPIPPTTTTLYTLFAVGKNNAGQAGLETTSFNVNSFTRVTRGHFKDIYNIPSFMWTTALSATPSSDTWCVAGNASRFQILFGLSASTTFFTPITTGKFTQVMSPESNLESLVGLSGKTLFGVGFNNTGALGVGLTANEVTSLTPLTGEWEEVIGLNFGGMALSANTNQWFAWGSNNNGELGNGTLWTSVISPVPVSGNWSNVVPAPSNPTVYALSANTNQWFAWGNNTNGQMVNGSSGVSINRTALPFTTGGWSRVVPGGSFVYLLSTGTNKWFTCGNNFYGVFGNGQSGVNATNNTQLTLVPGEWKDVVINGSNSVFALSAQGNQWYAVGRNDFGQLGLNFISSVVTTFRPVTSLSPDINWKIYPGFTTFALSSVEVNI